MIRTLVVRAAAASALLFVLFLAPSAFAQPQIYVNEFYRGGNLGTTDEWVELVLQVPLTAAQLEGFYVGDSTGTTVSKFSGYKFTNMSAIAANFPAGTIIVVAGTTGPAADASYNPASNDWNIVLKTAGGNLSSNGSTGDFAATDVVYVDTNGTNGNSTLSSAGFAVNWHGTPGAFGSAASVTITAPANNTGAVLTTGLNAATTSTNWTSSVALGSMTPGQPNGGANTTYINNLRNPQPGLTISDVSQAEGAAGTTVYTFAVTLSAPAGGSGVTFDIATADNTATTADNDYVANSLTGQSIGSGTTGPFNFQVTVNGDNNPEPTETFFVNVTNVSGANVVDGQGTGTITTDDAPPTLTINDPSSLEGNTGTGTITFTVTLSAPAPPLGVTFDIATADNTATTAGNDYVARSLTTQTIAAGETSYTFDVTINGDTGFEPNETFFVNVTNVAGAVVGDAQGQGTITNDDAQPTFTIADVVLTEGNAGTQLMTFTVTLTGNAASNATVNWTTADGAATAGGADYVANSGTLTFVPGDTSEQFTVTVNGDTTSEGDEHLNITLSGATVATIGDANAFGVIRNDDAISIAAPDTPVTQSMDALHPATSPATPAGWTFSESDTNANLTYSFGTGSSTSGDTYAFSPALADPDRAFGTLQSGSLLPTIGGFYRNDTGAPITSLTIEYWGEQYRSGDSGRADRLDFQYSLDATSLTTGTWTHVDALDFSSPVQDGSGVLNANLAANRRRILGQITGLSIPANATFWVRYTDFNASGSDDGLAVDDFSIIANFTGAFLSIDDKAILEGNAGTSVLTFTVTLSQPAPPGGVTFDIATADVTATAPTDYVGINLVGETIAAGQTSKQYNITVNGDVDAEASETFLVNITNVTNALVQDGQGVGTIVTDDVTLTNIHDIQGPGASSPIIGSSVTVRAVVTGVKSNGYFIQEDHAEDDVATSEGIFVFTGGAPPAGVVMGALVQVSGTVAEFVPSGDPMQPPLTEITAPSTVVISTGNALPAPVVLSATFPNPAGAFDQLERVEGMRVTVNSMTVSGPSDGSFDEENGTGTSNGRFYGVVTGVPRPFREPGIQAPDTVPSGSIPPIPRWDFNPERLKVESAGLTGQPVITVKASDVVGPITGPLDYGFRAYAILPDGTSPISVTPGTLPTTVTAPLANDVTVASFNLQRFFDDVDNASGHPDVTAAAWNLRLGKASKAIRDHLRFPDIIGVQEVERLEALQDLAARISSDALVNGQPDPQYVAYLVEGNDVGGIDVGYLVKTAPVAPGLPRVTVNAVTQELDGTTWIDPDDNQPATLHDRPPLVLDATVNRLPGVSYDLVVINNHLRSLLGIESEAPDGLTTEGDRVRRKRLAQAQDLANYIQGRQSADSAENLIVIGDFNAFEFNDGYVDVMNTIAGTPPPDNETVVPGDGADLVNPNLDNLVDTPPPSERYSYVHEGNAQNIDHALVNQALIASTSARRIEHPRIDADYPDTERNNGATALRISDHDPLVAYLTVPLFAVSDFGVDLQHATGYATAGVNTTYTIVVTNNGPDAGAASLSFPLPATTTFVSIVNPGWSCTTPAVGANGTITCTIASLAPSTPQNFSVVVNVPPNTPVNTVLAGTATIDGTNTDVIATNDSDSQNVTSLQPSQYRASKTVSGSFLRGSTVTYAITIFNDKPFAQTDNPGDELTDVLPSGLTLVSASASSGTAVANIGTNTVTWNGSIVSGGTATITITATVDTDATGTQSNQAGLSNDFDDDGLNDRNSLSDDPNVGGAFDPTNFTVVQAGVTATKSVSGTFVSGTNVTYTVVLTNNMAFTQPNNFQHEFTDILPAGLTYVGCTASSGTCALVVAPDTFAWNGTIAANGGQVTITITATIAAASGTISNQGQSIYDSDNDNSNESSSLTDDPGTPAANDPTVFNVVPANSFVITKRDTAGSYLPGGNVNYQVVLTNGLGHTLADNAGNEFVDVLPSSLQLVSASATSGTAVATAGTNTVTWNGAIASGGTVTITINANIPSSATAGTISNQGTASIDLDNNGSNETNRVTDDPDTVAANDATSFTLSTPSQVSVTKSVSTSGVQGSSATYTVTINNTTSHALADNAGNEFTDVLPAQLDLVSAAASSGTAVANTSTNTVTWNGSVASSGSVTITIVAAIPADAPTGTASNQGSALVDVDNNGTNETTILSNDPTTPASSDPTSFQIVSSSQVTVSKTVSTIGQHGAAVTYTITITNNLPHTLTDNPGDEFVDVLPSQLTLVGATATGGVVTSDVPTRTVRWNGSIASGGVVTITINATLNHDATGAIVNQGTFNADLDNNGTNETALSTDDPSTAGPGGTSFNVFDPEHIPTLSWEMLLGLAAMLAVVAALKMRS